MPDTITRNDAMTPTDDALEEVLALTGPPMSDLSLSQFGRLKILSSMYFGQLAQAELNRRQPAASVPLRTPPNLSPEMHASLLRFIETTDDDQSYDINREELLALIDFGAIRRCGGSACKVTTLGMWLAKNAAACGREQGGWIPVSEGLPPEDVKQVFCWDADDKKVSACGFPSGWPSMRAYPWITHWRLVTPPQELQRHD